MNNIIENIINSIIGSDSASPISVKLAIPQSQLSLHNELQHYAASSDGCGGYTGHCPCANNPCMICSSAH